MFNIDGDKAEILFNWRMDVAEPLNRVWHRFSLNSRQYFHPNIILFFNPTFQRDFPSVRMDQSFLILGHQKEYPKVQCLLSNTTLQNIPSISKVLITMHTVYAGMLVIHLFLTDTKIIYKSTWMNRGDSFD